MSEEHMDFDTMTMRGIGTHYSQSYMGMVTYFDAGNIAPTRFTAFDEA
jgi:hypothetical protein